MLQGRKNEITENNFFGEERGVSGRRPLPETQRIASAASSTARHSSTPGSTP
jgi:hypothetical protein